MRRGLVVFDLCVASDNHQITFVNVPCGGAIQTNFTGFAVNHVGRKASAIVAVVDLDFLELIEMRGFAKCRVDGGRASP